MAPNRGSRSCRQQPWLVLTTAALGVGLGLLACGGGQTRSHPLDRGWDDESGEELAALVAEWRAKPAPPPPDLVVGVVDHDTVVGRELPAGAGWTLRHPVAAHPAIAGDLVLLLGDGKLVALDGRTGEPLWERPAVGGLRGAADDGELTVVSFESLSGRRSTVLAVDRAGVVVRQLDVSARVGAPAVVDGVGFLPWNDQVVVIFDLRAGKELARIPCSSRVSHAIEVGGEIFMGEETLLHFDSGIVGARYGASVELRLPSRSLPGDPWWLRRGAAPSPLGGDAARTVGLVARPVVLEPASGPGGARPSSLRPMAGAPSDDDERAPPESGPSGARLGFANGIVLARAHRAAVGLDATSAEARWVRVADAPSLSASGARDGFCLCDTSGAVECLEAQTGARAWRAELGVPLVACALQVEQIGRAPGPNHRRVAPPIDRVAQLGAALRDRDPALLALQAELVADLDRLAGERATTELIALGSGELGPAELRAAVRARLEARRTGLGAMQAALEAEARRPRLASFVVPVAELSRALGQAGHAAAAPALAKLAVRAPLGETAVALAEALEQLARPDELRAVAAMAARHSCGPAGPERTRVVLALARTAQRLGDDRLVRAMATQRCLEPALRAELGGLLEPAGP